MRSTAFQRRKQWVTTLLQQHEALCGLHAAFLERFWSTWADNSFSTLKLRPRRHCCCDFTKTMLHEGSSTSSTPSVPPSDVSNSLDRTQMIVGCPHYWRNSALDRLSMQACLSLQHIWCLASVGQRLMHCWRGH
jgi:hypothetical protein